MGTKVIRVAVREEFAVDLDETLRRQFTLRTVHQEARIPLLHKFAVINRHGVAGAVLDMGKGPKRTLKLVNYRLESRPLTDPRPRSLGLDLDLTQNRARPSNFM